MTDAIWINPVVKGSCDPFGGCGGGCCKIKVYDPGNETYTLRWCEHFNESTRRCKIYETRPEGCRKYPQVNTFLKERWLIPGCSYYLAVDVRTKVPIESFSIGPSMSLIPVSV